ncbi:MAG: hypothetical protein IPP83_07285 [Flavobacteriales bacterium]|nr:hypothetical protein [Flavobacteriales bacterium]
MIRTLTSLLLCALATAASARSFMPEMNRVDPKEFGEPLKTTLVSADMEKDEIAPVAVEFAVQLKKPIVMGCKYIFRITNTSDRTVVVKGYTVPDQKFSEKLKPGASIDLLTNTMMRCGATKEEKKEHGCDDRAPSINIQEVEVK